MKRRSDESSLVGSCITRKQEEMVALPSIVSSYLDCHERRKEETTMKQRRRCTNSQDQDQYDDDGRKINERTSTFVKVKHRGEKCRNMSTSNVCVSVCPCLSPSSSFKRQKEEKYEEENETVSRLLLKRWRREACPWRGSKIRRRRDAPDWHTVWGGAPKKNLKKVASQTRQLFLCKHSLPPLWAKRRRRRKNS